MHEISFENGFDKNIDIPVLPRAEIMHVDVEMFGNFGLDGDRSSTNSNFETDSNESTKSRFGGISDSEIEKLISSKKIKIQKETLIWHLVFSKIGAK